MEKPVVIFGAGGLGKAALEVLQSNGIVAYCFLDDNQALHGTEINGVSVLGATDDDGFLKYIGQKCEAFVAVDETKYRKNLVDMLLERREVMPMNAIHHTAEVSKTAFIGHGNFINTFASVGTHAKIDNHCIIHAGACIDFEAQLEDFVQVGAGSIINSGATIKKNAFIGSGVTIVSGVTIGKGARVGAGSVVVADVKDNETVFGNPAVKI